MLTFTRCRLGVTMQDIILAVKKDWTERNIPVNYLMFDSWWYRKDGDPDPKNASSWPIRTPGGVLEWYFAFSLSLSPSLSI